MVLDYGRRNPTHEWGDPATKPLFSPSIHLYFIISELLQKARRRVSSPTETLVAVITWGETRVPATQKKSRLREKMDLFDIFLIELTWRKPSFTRSWRLQLTGSAICSWSGWFFWGLQHWFLLGSHSPVHGLQTHDRSYRGVMAFEQEDCIRLTIFTESFRACQSWKGMVTPLLLHRS